MIFFFCLEILLREVLAENVRGKDINNHLWKSNNKKEQQTTRNNNKRSHIARGERKTNLKRQNPYPDQAGHCFSRERKQT